jgi:threonine dehydrogenase-like Zn-dependent dehydrogenase
VTSADVAEPRLGPGDVVVRVERAGICGSDVNRFLYGSHPWPSGFIMGHESAARSSRSAPESAKRTSATRCSSSPRSAAARASHGWNLAAVEPAVACARKGGTIVLLGIMHEPVTLDYKAILMRARGSIRAARHRGDSLDRIVSDGLEPLARSKADHVKIQVSPHDS